MEKKCFQKTSGKIVLMEPGNGRPTIIPRNKCIRIEFLEREQYERATAK